MNGGTPSTGDRLGLTPREKAKVVALYAGILGATGAAFVATFVLGFAYPILGALAIAAYVFGLQHGVDADHIVAIDNTTRKLLQEEKRPLTVGTWFSLGHSTIVVGFLVALVATADALYSWDPAFRQFGGVAGTLVSGCFLFLIGLINVVIAREVYRIFRRVRTGELDERGLEATLAKRGFMNRYMGSLFRLVSKPWQIYPVGVLFGLGFDTASQVGFLALALGAKGEGVPLLDVLLLPVMFTCGMVLVDTSDAVAMRVAYGWAFLKPVRKIYYNLTLTVISVLVAFAIGGLELLAVVSTELGLRGGIWSSLNLVNSDAVFELLGLAIITLFVASWLVAIALYRIKGYERTGLGGAPPSPEPRPEREVA
ncbi:MAG: HoxN/HupN/NixA family nickel/cobalt transporter [Euryarchaeota archaeon]|nr:HoxN/HupN/NixA family nickel/cobalt transporter [Euryarchaeota archaeon]MDE1835839.1 HoxN/HupN/NixA family nickel/cobalt transporter [Euryarchaeota archaeon]MDE1880510.1 HoxN/HupN/NixA family nickel/cobalt transporter [Euryarchaeota archaeon]MDE2045813.1 HoxN/HupN/NixA family nickel/cobalt transporter [Thermoplasmata archaeon]